jgi:hypothetical protein
MSRTIFLAIACISLPLSSVVVGCAEAPDTEQPSASTSNLGNYADTDECNPVGLIAGGTGCDDAAQDCVQRHGVYVCVDRPTSSSSSSSSSSGQIDPIDCSAQGDECGACAAPSLIEDCTISRGAQCVNGYCVD